MSPSPPFSTDDLGWQRSDLPRQLLIITILATVTGHFLEIHFGIAIAATRTYFWVQAALLVVVGMRWALPSAYTIFNKTRKRRSKSRSPRFSVIPAKANDALLRGQRPPVRRVGLNLPSVPATVMTDLLTFLAIVFLYTTNAQQPPSPLAILFSSVFQRNEGGQISPALPSSSCMLFTWVVAATIGLVATALATTTHAKPFLVAARLWHRMRRLSGAVGSSMG